MRYKIGDYIFYPNFIGRISAIDALNGNYTCVDIIDKNIVHHMSFTSYSILKSHILNGPEGIKFIFENT